MANSRLTLIVLAVSIIVALIAGYSMGKRTVPSVNLGAVGPVGTPIVAEPAKEPIINLIEDDRVLVCIYPPAELDGKYIIRPRCDNINLNLQCSGVKPTRKYPMFGPIVIACPDQDKNFTPEEIYTDVILASKDKPICVPCSISDFFVLNPDEKDNYEKCGISGRFYTKGIRDPAVVAWERDNSKSISEFKPDPEYRRDLDEYCFNKESGFLLDLEDGIDLELPTIKASVVFEPKSGKPFLTSNY